VREGDIVFSWFIYSRWIDERQVLLFPRDATNWYLEMDYFTFVLPMNLIIFNLNIRIPFTIIPSNFRELWETIQNKKSSGETDVQI